MDLELRSIDATELRVELGAEGKPARFVGYAAVFDSPSQDLGGFVEVIKPGAFRRTLSAGGDIRALVDHDPSRLLGRTSAGTLRAVEDVRGLLVDVDIPDVSYARDLMTLVARGDVRGMSFAFRKKPPGETWYRANGAVTREITDLDLIEVTFTSTPAYLDTEVSLRVDPSCVSRAKEFEQQKFLPDVGAIYRRNLLAYASRN